jgi:hypothetical protein
MLCKSFGFEYEGLIRFSPLNPRPLCIMDIVNSRLLGCCADPVVIMCWASQFYSHLTSSKLLQALGLNVNKDVVRQVAGSFDGGLALLQQLMPAVLRSLHHSSTSVCTASSPFLTAYLARMKNVLRRQGGEVGATTKQWLLLILRVRVYEMRGSVCAWRIALRSGRDNSAP